MFPFRGPRVQSTYVARFYHAHPAKGSKFCSPRTIFHNMSPKVFANLEFTLLNTASAVFNFD